MKILYHHRTASRDGQAVHIHEMITALREIGCEVIVVEPTPTARQEFGADVSMVARLKIWAPKWCYELAELAYNVVAYLRLRRSFKLHSPDVLYERHNLYLLAGRWLQKRLRVPLLLEVNSPLAQERGEHDGLAMPRLARELEVWAWRGADRVFPVTEVLGQILIDAGVQSDRVRVIPNAINPGLFGNVPSEQTAKDKLGLTDKVVLGFTGFVRSWHRLDLLIDFIAGSSRKDLYLLIVGDGPARRDLEQHARLAGVADRVRFTGIVPRDRVASHVMAFDVALQPAATSYASPLKLFEYLYLGRAVIAPRQANLLEVLVDGDNAVLFEPGDEVSLLEALTRLVSDADLRQRIGEAARATVERKGLTWRQNAERVVAEAEQVLAERGARVPIRLTSD